MCSFADAMGIDSGAVSAIADVGCVGAMWDVLSSLRSVSGTMGAAVGARLDA